MVIQSERTRNRRLPLKPGVQDVAKLIAHQVDAEDGYEECDAGKQADTVALIQHVKYTVGDQESQGRLGNRQANAPGRQRCLDGDGVADLLSIDGDPLDDLGLLQDQGQQIPVIMKDGKFLKNTLGA